MKKWIAMLVACALMLGATGLAAQWPEGRSAAQPYSGVPEVDLTQTMGYIVLYPRAKLPAEGFCGKLEIFLPREDIERGEGCAHVYELPADEGDAVEIAAIDFADEACAGIRPMTEEELDALMWGGGTCVELRLPTSLEFGDAAHSYYVLTDEGCFTAANGAVRSLAINNPEAWVPVVQGQYGVSGLRYVRMPRIVEADEGEDEVIVIDGGDGADAEAEEAGEAEETEASAEAEAGDDEIPPVGETVAAPSVGDLVEFDLVMGGDAAYAVAYSDNDSVSFEVPEYAASGHVTGTVTREEVQWGVVFLTDSGDVLEVVNID